MNAYLKKKKKPSFWAQIKVLAILSIKCAIVQFVCKYVFSNLTSAILAQATRLAWFGVVMSKAVAAVLAKAKQRKLDVERPDTL